MPRWHSDEGSGACCRVRKQDGEASTLRSCLLVGDEEPHLVRGKQCLSHSVASGSGMVSGERRATSSPRQLSGMFAVVA